MLDPEVFLALSLRERAAHFRQIGCKADDNALFERVDEPGRP
jgi:hypothetical protein